MAFFIALVGLALFLTFAGGYIYLLFSLGRWLASIREDKITLTQGIFAIALGWIPFCALVSLLPLDPLMRIAAVLSTYILHAQPTIVGFWSAWEEFRNAAENRWQKNVDDWLAEWECAPDPALDDENRW